MTRAAAALALLLGGCTVIVGGEPPPSYSCRVDGRSDPCRGFDPPMQCVPTGDPDGLGTCQPCGVEVCGNGLDEDCDGTVDEATESCNGEDDDCDAQIDEDLDDDGDGYTWCPTGPTELDCDDGRADVNPGVGEDLCDGLDNDCDPDTRNGEDSCNLEGNQRCDAMLGTCVEVFCDTRANLCMADQFCDQMESPPRCRALDTSCFSVACEGGTRCNPTTGVCVDPQQNGATCDDDSECLSNLCVPGAALLASADLGGADGICGTTCCTDRDCEDGARCWTSGTGARACVPTTLLEMGRFGAPTESACASRSDCPGEECVFVNEDAYELPELSSIACGPPNDTRPPCSSLLDCATEYSACRDGRCMEKRCNTVGECASGLCAGLCQEPCGSAGDCPRGFSWRFGDGAPGCTYLPVERSDASRTDWLPRCDYATSARGTQGSSCTQDSDCRDAACVDESGDPFAESERFCADTCCNEDDCGSGQQCRPIFIHDHWETHCLPEPTFPALGERPT